MNIATIAAENTPVINSLESINSAAAKLRAIRATAGDLLTPIAPEGTTTTKVFERVYAKPATRAGALLTIKNLFCGVPTNVTFREDYGTVVIRFAADWSLIAMTVQLGLTAPITRYTTADLAVAFVLERAKLIASGEEVLIAMESPSVTTANISGFAPSGEFIAPAEASVDDVKSLLMAGDHIRLRAMGYSYSQGSAIESPVADIEGAVAIELRPSEAAPDYSLWRWATKLS